MPCIILHFAYYGKARHKRGNIIAQPCVIIRKEVCTYPFKFILLFDIAF